MEFFSYFFIFFLMNVEFFQKKNWLGTLNIQAMVKGYVWSENKVKDPNVILTMIEPIFFYFFIFIFFLMTVDNIQKKIQPGILNIQAMVKGYV